MKFISEKRRLTNLNEEIKKVSLEEANRLNDVVTFMNHKSKISVTQKQLTENGKLLKEQYVLCTPIHSTLIGKMLNIALQSVNR
jgi:hypothetical protein